jgi:hypothetical protein
MAIDDDIERRQSHLAWLDENPEESDAAAQRAETERAIELARQMLALLA